MGVNSIRWISTDWARSTHPQRTIHLKLGDPPGPNFNLTSGFMDLRLIQCSGSAVERNFYIYAC